MTWGIANIAHHDPVLYRVVDLAYETTQLPRVLVARQKGSDTPAVLDLCGALPNIFLVEVSLTLQHDTRKRPHLPSASSPGLMPSGSFWLGHCRRNLSRPANRDATRSLSVSTPSTVVCIVYNAHISTCRYDDRQKHAPGVSSRSPPTLSVRCSVLERLRPL